jgi:hypothetical protein
VDPNELGGHDSEADERTVSALVDRPKSRKHRSRHHHHHHHQSPQQPQRHPQEQPPHQQQQSPVGRQQHHDDGDHDDLGGADDDLNGDDDGFFAGPAALSMSAPPVATAESIELPVLSAAPPPLPAKQAAKQTPPASPVSPAEPIAPVALDAPLPSTEPTSPPLAATIEEPPEPQEASTVHETLTHDSHAPESQLAPAAPQPAEETCPLQPETPAEEATTPHVSTVAPVEQPATPPAPKTPHPESGISSENLPGVAAAARQFAQASSGSVLLPKSTAGPLKTLDRLFQQQTAPVPFRVKSQAGREASGSPASASPVSAVAASADASDASEPAGPPAETLRAWTVASNPRIIDLAKAIVATAPAHVIADLRDGRPLNPARIALLASASGATGQSVMPASTPTVTVVGAEAGLSAQSFATPSTEPAEVYVDDPRIKLDSQKCSYADFGVRATTASGHTVAVRRRLVEFEFLRASLESSGILPAQAPALPVSAEASPSASARIDQKILEEHRSQLEAFLQCIVADPACRTSRVLARFLMRARPASALRSSYMDPAAGQWLGAGRPRDAPADSSAALSGTAASAGGQTAASAPGQRLPDVSEERELISSLTADAESPAEATSQESPAASLQDDRTLQSDLAITDPVQLMTLSIERLERIVAARNLRVIDEDCASERELLVRTILKHSAAPPPGQDLESAKARMKLQKKFAAPARLWNPAPALELLYNPTVNLSERVSDAASSTDATAVSASAAATAPSSAAASAPGGKGKGPAKSSTERREAARRDDERKKNKKSGAMDVQRKSRSKVQNLLSSFKRRWCELREGSLYCYNDEADLQPLQTISLAGATIEQSSTGGLMGSAAQKQAVIMITEAEGKDSSRTFLRLLTPVDHRAWLATLQQAVAEASFVAEPIVAVSKAQALSMPTVVIDTGSCDIKAGIIFTNSTDEIRRPTVVLPSLCLNPLPGSGLSHRMVGTKALEPQNRLLGRIGRPFDPRSMYDFEAAEDLWAEAISRVNAKPDESGFVLTQPQHGSLSNRRRMAEIFFESFRAARLSLHPQSVLSLYSYGQTSGIVVDIGDRIDVLPIIDGFAVSGGEAQLQWGGRDVSEHLARLMSESGYRYFGPAEQYVVRMVKEAMCYVSQTPSDDLQRMEAARMAGKPIDGAKVCVMV